MKGRQLYMPGKKGRQRCYMPDKFIFPVSGQTWVLDPQVYWYFLFQTNLGPTSVNLFLYAPKVANLRFWKIGLTIAL